MYKENPKTKGSGVICAIPQTDTCPMQCDDCFFQSGRSFLEPLDENLPNMPELQQSIGRLVRVNDGNDSNNQKSIVMLSTSKYQFKFYNTSIPAINLQGHSNIEKFDAPVVLTLNPGKMTDIDWHKLPIIPENLMFVRIRTNTWNLIPVVIPAVEYYSEREIPIVLTFMAYFDTKDKIPPHDKHNYVFRKRTLNSYNAITTNAWDMVMSLFNRNKWVHSCGKIEGELGDTHCRFCGNCIREYYVTMEKMRND